MKKILFFSYRTTDNMESREMKKKIKRRVKDRNSLQARAAGLLMVRCCLCNYLKTHASHSSWNSNTRNSGLSAE